MDVCADEANMQRKQAKKKRLCWPALLIRILSVPPVLAVILMLSLWVGRRDYFRSGAELAAALLCLAGLPLAAYPLSVWLPAARSRGREGQRDLAFLLSALGYGCCWAYGLLAASRPALLFIFATYVFSVLYLLLFNKLLKLRASGHACGITGPMLVLCTLFGGWCYPLCLAGYGTIFWASIKVGRHTVKEFLLGTLCCILAAGSAWLLYL